MESRKKTVISFDDLSATMIIRTSDYHMMRFFDKYVENSVRWRLTEVGRTKGEIVSKTYEAPRKCVTFKMLDDPSETEETNALELDKFQEMVLE